MNRLRKAIKIHSLFLFLGISFSVIYPHVSNTESLPQNLWRYYPQFKSCRCFVVQDIILWGGTSDYGIFRLNINDETFNWFDHKDGLLDDNIIALSLAKDGTLWISTLSGLNSYKDGVFKSYTIAGDYVMSRVFNAVADSFGNLWVAPYNQNTGKGSLLMFDGVKWTDFTDEVIKSDGYRIWDIVIDTKGNVWCCPERGALSCYDGEKWTTYPYNVDSNGDRHALAADDKGNIWFGSGNFLYKFDGNKFVRYYAGVIYHIAIDKNGIVWCSSYSSIVYLENNHLYGGPNGFHIDSIAVDNYDHLWVSSYIFGGVYGFSLPLEKEPVIVENLNEKLTQYCVNTPYPNPFNPITTISYYIPSSDYVSIDVYSLSGQKVASLVNRFVSSGNNEINFDASGLSSGVYFYRFNSGDFCKSGKMLLLK